MVWQNVILNLFQDLFTLSSRQYYVYIITNYARTTLYIGVTNDLYRRMLEHRSAKVPGFSQRYRLQCLIYFEETDDIYAAIEREKQLKNWHRDWKINLIRSTNPQFKDLFNEYFEDAETSSA